MDAKTIWLIIFYICVIIIVLFLLIILIASLRVAGANDYPDTLENIDIYTLKTGDILTVSYRNIFGNFVTSWFNSVWSHSSLVYIDPDTKQIFLIECANYDKYYTKTIFKIPISTWIRFNRKSDIVLTRINKELDPHKLNDVFNKHASYMKLDSFSYKWYRLLYQQPYFEQTREKFTCYEMIIVVLQDVGVIKKLYACSSYNPSNIVKGELDFCDGYEFEPPVMLNVKHYNKLRENEEIITKSKNGCCK